MASVGSEVNPARVVTPEGVLLDFRPTGIATRVLGRLVDLALMAIVFLFVATLLGAVSPIFPAGVMFAIYAVVVFMFVFGYSLLFEVFAGGRTPGHRATGTRVIRVDGGPVRFRGSAIRAMLFLVDGPMTVGFGGVASIMASPKGQRLGDQAAGTMVVKLSDHGHHEARAFTVPPSLNPLAASLDLARLDKQDVLLARSILLRGADLRSGAQADIGNRICDHLDAKLGGVRPRGVGVDAFLTTVVATWSSSGGHRIDVGNRRPLVRRSSHSGPQGAPVDVDRDFPVPS